MNSSIYSELRAWATKLGILASDWKPVVGPVVKSELLSECQGSRQIRSESEFSIPLPSDKSQSVFTLGTDVVSRSVTVMSARPPPSSIDPYFMSGFLCMVLAEYLSRLAHSSTFTAVCRTHTCFPWGVRYAAYSSRIGLGSAFHPVSYVSDCNIRCCIPSQAVTYDVTPCSVPVSYPKRGTGFLVGLCSWDDEHVVRPSTNG